MSEEFEKKMDLYRLKTFLSSSPNIEFLMPVEESIDLSAINNTHLRMLELSNEPIRFIPVNSSQQEIDSWLLSSYDSFNLLDVFYLSIVDFSAAPWVRVKTHGTAQDWLLPLYSKLVNHRLQIVPLNLQYVFELREQEHRFSTFIEEV
jgi:hypothetical protein